MVTDAIRDTADKNVLVSSEKKGFKYVASQDIESVYHQMEVIDKKTPMTYGPIPFWASFFIGVPVWSIILIPFTIVSFMIHFGYILLITGKLFPAARVDENFDGGTSESDDSVSIIPRESRKYDLVLLGATGYTGKLATAYLASLYGGKCL